MQTIKQSESTAGRRTVYFTAQNSADSTAHTAALSGADLQISKAGGATANSAGTATHIGGGLYAYAFTATEVDTIGPVSIRISKAGVFGDCYVYQVVSFDPYNSASLGLSNVDVATSTRLATGTYAAPETLLTYASGVESGLTLQGALRLVLSGVAGRRLGLGTGTEAFRDYGNTKTRVSMSLDTLGNTTSVTYDAS